MTINLADLAVILIMLLCVLKARKRGITYFIVGTMGSLISLFLSATLYGRVASLLRKTPLFSMLYAQIKPVFSFESFDEMMGGVALTSNNAITEHILANDNSEIYKLFGVETFADYIASYVANIAINIISIMLVYLCVWIIIKAMFSANVVFSSIPVVKQVNHLLGMAGGALEGVLIIWLLVLALVLFALQGMLLPAYEQLVSSNIAVYFYRYNAFIYAILKISA